MKVYSVGREHACDIVINDPTNVISRRHATINVAPSGKMTIVDSSQNGTYVNGIRISSNVPVPVTRKDNVSFAHIAQLDWSLVPNATSNYIRYAAMLVVAIFVAAGGGFGYYSWKDAKHNPEEPVPVVSDSAKNDSVRLAKMREAEKLRQDSIRKHVKDSIDRANRQKEDKKKEDNKNKNNTEAKEKKDKDAEKKDTVKTIKRVR